MWLRCVAAAVAALACVGPAGAAALGGTDDPAAPRVVRAEYQLRRVDSSVFVAVPGKSGAAEQQASVLRRRDTHSAAVFTLFFDQPLHLDLEGGASSAPQEADEEDEGGAPSLYDVGRFLMLRADYRQVLYGLVSLTCPYPDDPDRKNVTFPSFPEHTDIDSRLPGFLLPLPHAKYRTLEWLNVLSQPEREMFNRTGRPNVLSYALILSEMRTLVAPDLVSSAREDHSEQDGDVKHQLNGDGSLTLAAVNYAERPELLDRCVVQLLRPEQSAEAWRSRARLVNFAGHAAMDGRYGVRRSAPLSRSFHIELFDQEALASWRYDREGSPVLEEQHERSAKERAWIPQNVFLEEGTVADATAQMMGVILAPISDKLMQMVMPMVDRINNYVIPALSKELILIFSGKGAPGSEVAPSFIELDEKGDKQTPQEKYRQWRQQMAQHPQDYSFTAAAHLPRTALEVTEADARRFEYPPRLHRMPVAETAPASAGVMRFEELSIERARMAEAAHSVEALQGGGGGGSVAGTQTQPGAFPKSLIKFLIKELTDKVTEGASKALTSAVSEDLKDFQLDDMKEWMAHSVAEALRPILAESVKRTVQETVPDMLERELPPLLTENVKQTAHNTLARALTHVMAPPLALSLARSTEEEYICSLCYYEKEYCDVCSWDHAKLARLLYDVDYLASEYSDSNSS